VAFRVFSSEGFQSTNDAVQNLTVDNRPPEVAITAPVEGEEGYTNVMWEFTGSASDAEDGILTNGRWSSSLDGFLGDDSSVTTRTLSAGSHTISLTAQDTEGLAATAQVDITVTTLETIDLMVVSNMLALSIPGRDYTDTSPPTLVTGETQVATLVTRNVGRQTDYTVQMYIEPPSGGVILMAQQVVSNAPPFEENYLEVDFVPTEKGPYVLMGVVTNTAPADRDLANNGYKWDYTSLYPPHLTVEPVADFGDVALGGEMTATLTVTNTGEQTLVMGQLSVTGAQATAFTLKNDNCSGASVSAGEHRSVDVTFAPMQVERYAGYVILPSNDPTAPEGAVLLVGAGVPEPFAGFAVAFALFFAARRSDR
jgi:hypothetical protein